MARWLKRARIPSLTCRTNIYWRNNPQQSTATRHFHNRWINNCWPQSLANDCWSWFASVSLLVQLIICWFNWQFACSIGHLLVQLVICWFNDQLLNHQVAPFVVCRLQTWIVVDHPILWLSTIQYCDCRSLVDSDLMAMTKGIGQYDALMRVVQMTVNDNMIAYLAHIASGVIEDSNNTGLHPPSPPVSRTRQQRKMPSLEQFIAMICRRSNVRTPTLLTSVVYLRRLQQRLPNGARGMACTQHRIFLAALMLAAKYLNDSSPSNRHWSNYSAFFSLAEVNLMEKQMLFLLSWDLAISLTDIFDAFDPFIQHIRAISAGSFACQNCHHSCKLNELTFSQQPYAIYLSSKQSYGFHCSCSTKSHGKRAYVLDRPSPSGKPLSDRRSADILTVNTSLRPSRASEQSRSASSVSSESSSCSASSASSASSDCSSGSSLLSYDTLLSSHRQDRRTLSLRRPAVDTPPSSIIDFAESPVHRKCQSVSDVANHRLYYDSCSPQSNICNRGVSLAVE